MNGYDVLVQLDLGAEEPLMGAGTRFNREAAISLGRPSVLDVAPEELPPEVAAARGAHLWSYLQLLFPFDLEEPTEGMTYLEAVFEVSLDGGEVVGRQLSASRYDDADALGNLTTFGDGRAEFRWRLRPAAGSAGLTDGSRVARVLLQVPPGVTSLTGTIAVSAKLADPELGLEVEAATPERQPFVLSLVDGTYSPVMSVREPVDPDPQVVSGARRLCVAVDIEAYSKRPPGEQLRLQEVLVRVLDGALAAALRPMRGCHVQEQGDGRLVVMPPGIDEPRVVRWFLRELASGLAAANRPVRPELVVRMRVALDEGVVLLGANGYGGHSIIRACRMRDSAAAKEALATASGYHVVIVSDDIYEESVMSAFEGDPTWRFNQITAVVPDKGFTEHCWIHVPVREPDQH
ncbi:hypothetical protein Acor_72760 [Acrocarpospora corrugata]|uniref:Guanylate cyclase domain-containing protein n=1 Tax=Acrocarpospora corrugata TaxID=35763 RepID=A0A5M3WFP7_9ACTN|nr:hypothetical protein [Acrocarpospora corrugata]GES05208.1 hypothetical protein Acor_72760 [Acrocarpospora corrugata]